MSRFCLEAGCPEVIEGKGSYCQRHDPWERRQPWAGSASQANRRSGWQWTQIRKRVLRRDHYRCGCGRHASEVDHIIPVAECVRRGLNPDDPSNLRAICTDCHARKTEQDRLRGVRRHRES